MSTCIYVYITCLSLYKSIKKKDRLPESKRKRRRKNRLADFEQKEKIFLRKWPD